MIAVRLVGAAALFAVILLGASPAKAQAYVPGVTCPAGQAVTARLDRPGQSVTARLHRARQAVSG